MTNTNPTINLKETQIAINKIFDHIINNLGKEEIELHQSYYWCIDKNAKYDPMQDPNTNDMSLGDLVADLSSLQKLTNNDELPTPLHFIFASSVLMYLAETDDFYK